MGYNPLLVLPVSQPVLIKKEKKSRGGDHLFVMLLSISCLFPYFTSSSIKVKGSSEQGAFHTQSPRACAGSKGSRKKNNAQTGSVGPSEGRKSTMGSELGIFWVVSFTRPVSPQMVDNFTKNRGTSMSRVRSLIQNVICGFVHCFLSLDLH